MRRRNILTQVMKFEPQASADPAIQRAVERSRDMLAQISAANTSIAQAAPQATIAASNHIPNGKAVQQTSQSGTPNERCQPCHFGCPGRGDARSQPQAAAAPTAALPERLPCLARRHLLQLRQRRDRCRPCRPCRRRHRATPSRRRFRSPCQVVLVRTRASQEWFYLGSCRRVSPRLVRSCSQAANVRLGNADLRLRSCSQAANVRLGNVDLR